MLAMLKMKECASLRMPPSSSHPRAGFPLEVLVSFYSRGGGTISGCLLLPQLQRHQGATRSSSSERNCTSLERMPGRRRPISSSQARRPPRFLGWQSPQRERQHLLPPSSLPSGVPGTLTAADLAAEKEERLGKKVNGFSNDNVAVRDAAARLAAEKEGQREHERKLDAALEQRRSQLNQQAVSLREAKRQQQEEYRRTLEAQMAAKKASADEQRQARQATQPKPLDPPPSSIIPKDEASLERRQREQAMENRRVIEEQIAERMDEKARQREANRKRDETILHYIKQDMIQSFLHGETRRN